MYLFWRWHCSGEPFPCFRTSEDWYSIKLLKRDNVHIDAALSDSTARDWTRRIYNAGGIKGSKVTHMPRASGSRIAEANNVSEAQVSYPISTAIYTNYLDRFDEEAAGIAIR